MGKTLSKPNERVRNIDREVSSFRSNFRSSNRKLTKDVKDQLVETLVRYSNEVSTMKGKVHPRYREQVQNNISRTMEEILSRNTQEFDLDMGAVETTSFVQVNLNKKQISNKDFTNLPGKKQKSANADITLQDVEEKLKLLKPQINVAIEQKDLTQLRVQQNTIEVLATHLEMILVKEHTPLGDKKKRLNKSIVSQYQKITKAMPEIRRHKDIAYLMEQNRRIVSHLEDIQKELSDIDSIVLKLPQNTDQSIINTLRENLLTIKQRLLSVEAIDEGAKQKQVQLLKKHAEILKNIDDSINNTSQSDLIKAQMNYEEIIKNIASGHRIDKDEVKVKLQSLQSFINSIKDDNENTFKGKQQLLTNVRQSFSFILDQEPKIENTEQLSNKQNNSDFKDASVHDFYNNWKTLQKNITPNSLSDWSETVKILNEVQLSIQEKTQEIAEFPNSPLNKKLNYSTPNLSSPKLRHSKFGSNLSVDHVDQSFIKTRAKIYNLPTPQIQNINNQQVVLRNKNPNPDDRRPFSELEEIKTQLNYIKEKFDESPQKQHLKNKLESYTEIIGNYIYHQNQRIARNAKILLIEIEDMLKRVSDIPQPMNNTSQRRSSIELPFENVVGIQESVEQLEQAIRAFDGKKGDAQYTNIEGRLSECRQYLQSIVIPPNYDMIQKQKQEILNKIDVICNDLERKCFYYQENEEISNTKKKLENLKEKVGRFSGAYQGVLYNQIEKDLHNLSVNVPEAVSEDVTKDVEQYLTILEHKATKDQSFRRTSSNKSIRNEDKDKLIKLKNDLVDIKTTFDTTPATAVNLFLGLKSRLDLVKFGLDQLKGTLEEEINQKQLLYNEVETLKNMVDAKASLAKEAISQLSLEQDKDKIELDELKKIEERFKVLKPEIEIFIGTTSDNKFFELDENSIRLILRIDKLQLKRGSEGHKRKLDLLKDIYSYGDLLDQRAKESEDLLEIERSVYDIENNVVRNAKLSNFEMLQEKIIGLKARLNSTNYNNHLLQRKRYCDQAIEDLIEKIAADNKNSSEEEKYPKNSEKNPFFIICQMELQFDNIKQNIENILSTHAGTQFQIDNSHLTDLFLTLDNFNFPEGSELNSIKVRLLKEMHEYTDILNKKLKQNKIFQEVSHQLDCIKQQIDNYNGKEEELKSIENELKSVQASVAKSKNTEYNLNPLDKQLFILIEKYNGLRKYNEEQKSYIGNTFIKDVGNNLNKNVLAENIPTEIRLTEIENEINLVRRKVTNFINNDSSEEYKTIEDALLMLKIILSKIDTGRNSDFIRKQHQLEQAIEESLAILDKRSLETATVMEIEEELDKIHEKFRGVINENEKSIIDEKLILLQVRFGKLDVNEDLMLRKNKCSLRIVNYLKHLKNIREQSK